MSPGKTDGIHHYEGQIQATIDFGFDGIKLDGCGEVSAPVLIFNFCHTLRPFQTYLTVQKLDSVRRAHEQDWQEDSRGRLSLGR